MTEQITKRKLQNILQKLSTRDMEILYALLKYRYMTTHHLRRLFFVGAVSKPAALRSCNRVLAKLRGLGIICALNRRIGGVRAGSGAFVWTLTPNGIKLLTIDEYNEETTPRKRSYEPSFAFLQHKLACVEIAVRLHELHMVKKLTLVNITNEPDCWRVYSGISGEVKRLKPDLFTVTAVGEYEDNWFLELDLASEAPSTVLKKCMQYIAYYRTGVEQRKSGVLPYVVWIVPDRKRQVSLHTYIQKSMPEKEAELFIVIVMDEFEPLLTLGAERFMKERTLP